MPVTPDRLESPHADAAQGRMAADVRAGLLARPLRTLPCKYFYDDYGSTLFDEITRLPEYYQTRTEERLLERHAARIVSAVRPVELCELGSGTSRKIRLLLDAGREQGVVERGVLFDINASVVADSIRRLEDAYPGLSVRGVVGDFQDDLAALGPGGGRMVLLLAGTIGNLHPERELPRFLRAVAGQLEPGDAFLVGLDLVKDEARLHAAYNDSAGITAEFNRNVLRVINAGLGADFDPEAWDHVAFYDRERAWIEMRLRARRDQLVRVPAAGLELALRCGEEIRTELSCKYTLESFEPRLDDTGLELDAWYEDDERLFAAALLRRVG